ncbi:MAG: ferrous iron transporter B, partial [Francisella sp.]
MNHYVISLIGNPNCGKTCLFNILTGSHQKVGNWPGVTTEKKVGDYFFAGKHYQVIDLPGTYTIESDKQGISEDEWIAREFTLNDQTSLLVNIVDASNLQRHLFLTFQLLEMRRPLIVVLNMMDVAQMKGIHIDILSLEKALGCPVIPIIATKKKGIKQLHSVIAQHLAQNKSLKTHIDTISKPVRTII